jgi:hypothetical protein
MSRRRWAVPCSAHRSDGRPCSAWAITGGSTCIAHGSATGAARAAAAHAWQLELTFRRIERDIARKTGYPLPPLLVVELLRLSADLTRRPHRRTRLLDGADAANLLGRGRRQ